MELKEVRQILAAHDHEDGIRYIKENDPLVQDGLTIFCKECYGGYEGGGEEHWVVMSVKDEAGNETFWKIPGFYQSHYGAELEFDLIFQVKPAEKVITVWDKA